MGANKYRLKIKNKKHGRKLVAAQQCLCISLNRQRNLCVYKNKLKYKLFTVSVQNPKYKLYIHVSPFSVFYVYLYTI